ncbi:unnamed protein product [Sphenostylis stenocarpa]|uniref:Pentatricopeptide repeat-containing protein n=1 Tax=Sphenostylis stenocarpa TaxID=92480 RepID=A0AA86VU37_9FABA|nr:unnamed protein product [Sphenostylis stenocarpa]
MLSFIELIGAATCKENGVGQAMKLLIEMMSKGCKPNVVTYNVVVKWICNEGRLDEAIRFLNKFPSYGCHPDVISQLSSREACALVKALNVLDMMPKHSCTPNSRSYNPLIEGFCNKKSVVRAIEYLEIMISWGCYPDVVTYSIFKGCPPVLIT